MRAFFSNDTCNVCGHQVGVQPVLVIQGNPTTPWRPGHEVRFCAAHQEELFQELRKMAYDISKKGEPPMYAARVSYVLDRSAAIFIVEQFLSSLESNWPGEHPKNRLEYLQYSNWDLDGPEAEEIASLQRIAKKLVDEHDLEPDFAYEKGFQAGQEK